MQSSHSQWKFFWQSHYLYSPHFYCDPASFTGGSLLPSCEDITFSSFVPVKLTRCKSSSCDFPRQLATTYAPKTRLLPLVKYRLRPKMCTKVCITACAGRVLKPAIARRRFSRLSSTGCNWWCVWPDFLGFLSRMNFDVFFLNGWRPVHGTYHKLFQSYIDDAMTTA